MGNCFSLISTRQGRKRLRIRFQQKSFQSGASRKSPISATSTRRSASSKATEECEVEAASGNFSFASDTSKAYIYNAADVDHAGGTDSQKFGILMAQETRAELRKSTMQRDSSGRKRQPAIPTTKFFGDRSHQGPRVQSSAARPQATPPSTKVYGDGGQMRNSPGGPRLVERADHDLMRKSTEESSPEGPRLAERADHDLMSKSPQESSSGGPRNVERADHCLRRNSPGGSRPVEKADPGHQRKTSSGAPRTVEKADPGHTRKNSSGVPRPVNKADPGHVRKNSSGVPRPVEKGDRGHMKNVFPGDPRPVERPNIGHVRTSAPGGPSPVEKVALAAIVDSLNQKGRRELETFRGFSPDYTGSLKDVTARKESSNRNGTGTKGNGRNSGRLYSRQHAPVDFDFLAGKFTKDSSRRGKQTSQAPKGLAKDVEPPRQTDENDQSGTSNSKSSSKSSLTKQEIDEFAKTYKESAAKAAARDRDIFKSMSAGESIDLSLSSMVSPPDVKPKVRPELMAEKRPEIWPEIRPRIDSHTRSASKLPLPELEPEIVPVPVTFGALINLESPSKSKSKAASPSIPRSAVTKNRNSPVINRPGIRAAGGRGGSPASRGGSPAFRGGSPATRGGPRRAQCFQSRNT